jgi:3-dehydroquinate synthase
MDYLEQSFSVKFEYKVYFTSGLFEPGNILLDEFLKKGAVPGIHQKIFFVIDQGVADAHPGLPEKITAWFRHQADRLPSSTLALHPVELAGAFLLIPGGESSKNDPSLLERILQAVDRLSIDRHSYLAVIGGGAVLDLAGYASAIAHRGLRHIRIPTTVLSQNDSGIGVKNSVNYFGKKNFLGSFAPPLAVFNDELFLTTLSERNWRSGIAEAVKVALIRDAGFFYWIEDNAARLNGRDLPAMNQLIRRCAELHLQHIAGGDPFETGSSRPLDFGHWSAHKLEQLTGFEVLHGEAVAMGIALDTQYSFLSGKLSQENALRIIRLLEQLGFAVTHPLMQVERPDSPLLAGLEEFREHLGGRLTIMLLKDIGKGEEVHELDTALLKTAGKQILAFSQNNPIIC